MTQGHFVWTDLSTYDMGAAKADYASLFGWSFAGDGAYDFASLDGAETAAVFPMPERLAEIEMPSFWMSYVRVDDLDATVAKARSHDGVIIEVEPQAFSADARIALVRDPSGAGFTLYEGPDITPPSGGAGQVCGRYHHVPHISMIAPFYRDLFGWRFEKSADAPWPVYDIIHPDGTVVAQAEEVPESIRGKFRYWMPCFAVTSASAAIGQIEAADGERLFDLTDGRILAADRQGAHFMIRDAMGGRVAGSSKNGQAATRAVASGGFTWKAVAGLACVWLAVFMDWQAFWGVLFLLWTWPALRSGRADFIEPVSRAGQPILYWALIGTWLLLSAWLIIAPFLGGG